MNVKAAIAVLLGLLFQWAHLAQAAVLADHCRNMAASHCECCADADSCPCATSEDQEPGRPLPPSLPETLKLPAAKFCETRVSLEDAPVPQAAHRVPALPAAETVAGYSGVSLSVAFCSFLM
jgi:hypothetical protein